jgi:hypothetical protein
VGRDGKEGREGGSVRRRGDGEGGSLPLLPPPTPPPTLTSKQAEEAVVEEETVAVGEGEEKGD